MSILNFDLLGDLVDETLNLNSEVAQETLVAGLRQQDLTVEAVDINWIPARLRELFSFRDDIALNPAQPYQAKSVAIAVFAVRLDKDGNIDFAAPSIKGAHTSAVGKFKVGGDWDTTCTIMPDLYVESEFWGDDEMVVPVPTIMKEPYPAQSGNVSLSLSMANKTLDNWLDYHTQQRQILTVLLGRLAEELGVPNGEQFLCCMFGFPQVSKAYENDKNTFWRAGFSGGYMLGGRKVGTSRTLPKALAGLQVKSNLLIGGKSMSARIAEEMAKAKGRTVRPAAPVRTMPPVTPKPVVAPTPAAPTPVASAPAPATEDAMPSANIFAKLNNLSAAQEEDDDFVLVEMPQEEIELAQQGAESMVDVEDDEPVVAAPVSKRANPFA